MKKIISLILALMLVLCMGAAAFAEGTTGDAGTTTTLTDHKTVTIKKVYKLIGAGTSPAETFTLQQVGNGRVVDGEATSAPALGAITGATFASGAATAEGFEGSITIALPTYTTVGVYEYTLKEVAGTTAGVTYYGNNIKLVVTVINGENGKLRIAAVHTEIATDENNDPAKSDTFANTYSAGTLNISKTVTGNLGDQDKYFEFKVTLTGETGKTYNTNGYAVSGGSKDSNPTSIKIGEETTFQLKHGDTISIANLPYDVSYTVTETAADGYTTTKTGNSGTINAADQTAAFTNNKTSEIDMGVSTDSLPYIVLLGIVALIGAAMIIKRRATND